MFLQILVDVVDHLLEFVVCSWVIFVVLLVRIVDVDVKSRCACFVKGWFVLFLPSIAVCKGGLGQDYFVVLDWWCHHF